jgi:uncharacterized protein (DUF2267 family)
MCMADYEEFVATVATTLVATTPGATTPGTTTPGAESDAARQATQAVLPTLAERLGKDEAVNLAPELGDELGALLFTAGPPQRLSVREFVERVAERERLDLATARRHTVAVFAAIGRVLSEQAYGRIRTRLPKEFSPLLPSGHYTGVPTIEDFVAAVAERAGSQPGVARRLTEAVLTTIAERVAPGEVDDLRGQLPIELQAALDRGLASNPGRATRMPADRFVARVADHAPGVTPTQARTHARALFDVLRETITDTEFYDLTAQLPDVYRALQASGADQG